MKKIVVLSLMIGFISCKEKSKDTSIKSVENKKEVLGEPSRYPVAFQEIINAHGGLENWKNKNTLFFEIPDSKEVHTTDLLTRKDRIDAPAYAMGYDGKEVWLLEKEGEYKGDAGFYHNLMFYFYSMPFVFADAGIQYGETESLEFEGNSYPGIKIKFNNGVGASSKDEYYLFYDPITYQMSWLGYTVTYRSGEKSDNVNWIRYNDWMEVDGIMLPRSITWYDSEGAKIKEPKKTVAFDNISFSQNAQPDSFYDIQKGAKVWEGK